MRRLVFIAFAAISLMPFAPVSLAHESPEDRLIELDQRLLDHPQDALAYLERGQLRYEEGEWRAALRDFDRAEYFDSQLFIVDLMRARTLLACEQPRHALEHADRYLEHVPQSAEGYLTRARILRALKLKQAAVSALTAAIALANPPSAELFLERADIVAIDEPGDLQLAIRSLDEGIARLGPLASLELGALDREIELGRYDDAIKRVDLLSSQATDPSHWLMQEAKILELAGRADAARTVYEQALAAISARPSYAAKTKAFVELERSAHAAIARIDDGVVAPAGPHAEPAPTGLGHGF